jgi:hypothetical protein
MSNAATLIKFHLDRITGVILAQWSFVLRPCHVLYLRAVADGDKNGRRPRTVRFSDQEWKDLEREGATDGLDVTVYVRLAALEKMRAAKRRREKKR